MISKAAMKAQLNRVDDRGYEFEMRARDAIQAIHERLDALENFTGKMMPDEVTIAGQTYVKKARDK